MVLELKQENALENSKCVQNFFSLKINSLFSAFETKQSEPIPDMEIKVDVCDWLALWHICNALLSKNRFDSTSFSVSTENSCVCT